MATTDLLIVSMFFFSFSRMLDSWNHTVYSLFILASFTYKYASKAFFFHIFFHDLIACLCLVLNNTLLCGHTRVYLSLQLWKESWLLPL